MSDKAAIDQRLKVIVDDFNRRLLDEGAEVIGATPRKDDADPAIFLFIHGTDCAARAGAPCDCRKPGEAVPHYERD